MNIKRMRGRNHRGNGGGGNFRQQQPSGIPLNRNHVFDSNGPEMRLRGTAQQLHEKYQQLARDASGSGDRVTAEAYYQHAEHYFRIIAAMNQAQGVPNGGQPNGQQPNGQQNQHGGNQNGQPNGSGGQPYVQEHQPTQNTATEDGGRRNGHRRPRYNAEAEAAPEASADSPVDIGPELDAELAAAAGGDEQTAESREIPILSAPPEG